MSTHAEQVAELLGEHGTTFAREAGITLRDTPSPLFQLLVLVTLLSRPIGADLSVAAARELFRAGWRTPERLRGSTWQQRVDALGRGRYRRFDESMATQLDETAAWVTDRWRGDLRRLADEAGEDPGAAGRLLQEAPGVGPTGAGIYLREVQAVWEWLRPYADDRVREAAEAASLPHTPAALARLAGTDDLSTLGAALIRARTS